MREFAGKTAVVTGAASRMGLAFARRFAAEGINVVLADIEEQALNAQVQRMEQEQRNIHILCNNAGVTGRDHAVGVVGGVNLTWDVPQSTWDWVIGVNFWGVLCGVQVFVPHMLEHGEAAHIVNSASHAGLAPDDIADLVFEAIVERRCYILPNPELDESIRGRVEHILARGAPISLDV